jgi:hypothetical protein
MPLNLMQANAGTQGLNQPLRPPVPLPPGVPQPGTPQGMPVGAPMGAMGTLGTPAGLSSLAAGGYRGANPVTTIGRGGVDFSNFPGAQNGVSPMGLPPQATMAPGMTGQMLPPAPLPAVMPQMPGGGAVPTGPIRSGGWTTQY